MKCIILILGMLISVGVAWGVDDPCSYSPSSIVLPPGGGSESFTITWTQNDSGILPAGCGFDVPISCSPAVAGCPGSPQAGAGSICTPEGDGTTCTFMGGFSGGGNTCTQSYVFEDTAG